MINCRKISDGRWQLSERFGRPTVYMDNWALNDVALSGVCSQQFIEGMNAKRGTLRISVSNLVELLKQTDVTQTDRILSLVDSIDAGFIDPNFKDVIARENALVGGSPDHQNPSQELSIVHAFLLAHDWPDRWRVGDIIKHVLENSDNSFFERSYDNFGRAMNQLLDRSRSDPTYMKKSLSRFRASRKAAPRYCTATRELITRAVDFMLQNRSMTMSANEWHDVYHTIVPVAYCDIVFLDARWCTFIAQSGLRSPSVAQVFSKSTLDQGLTAIHNWVASEEE